jgi:hypothetical protein
MRPTEFIEHELRTALDYQGRSADRPSTNPLVAEMRASNSTEIARLHAELAQARSGQLELSLAGSSVVAYTISASYLSRVLETLQGAYRAVFHSVDPLRSSRRATASLSVVGTAPGSFMVSFRTAPEQLDLLSEPLGDQAIEQIVRLLASAEAGRAPQDARAWAARADDAAVRAMIRFSVTLARSNGTTRVRWRDVNGVEQLVTIAAARARDLTVALAGDAGREVLEVVGHLSMAQDQPPRARVRTTEHTYLATVGDELLVRIRELLFSEVRATIAIGMTTSPTSGTPETHVELIDVDAA